MPFMLVGATCSYFSCQLEYLQYRYFGIPCMSTGLGFLELQAKDYELKHAAKEARFGGHL